MYKPMGDNPFLGETSATCNNKAVPNKDPSVYPFLVEATAISKGFEGISSTGAFTIDSTRSTEPLPTKNMGAFITENTRSTESLPTKKHNKFVSEPLGEKPVTAIPGIGPVLGARLARRGYRKASCLLGKYLVLEKNEQNFCEWLKRECKGNRRHCKDCYTAMKVWVDLFI